LASDKYCLLYTLPCQGELDGFRHAGSLPVRQDAHERHDIVFEGVIGRGRASAVTRVSLSKDHGDKRCMWKLRHNAQDIDVLEPRGHLTEVVLVLARNCNDRVLLSPDDAIPEYNLIPNLRNAASNELGA
jgi:hypothetical protein